MLGIPLSEIKKESAPIAIAKATGILMHINRKKIIIGKKVIYLYKIFELI